jgi:hypothetical protein
MGSMANTATNMKADQVGLEISAAIMKQIIDNQKMQGQQIVKMIGGGPSLNGTGSMVDVRA